MNSPTPELLAVARRMVEQGLSPASIANLLDLDLDIIMSIANSTTRSTPHLSIDEAPTMLAQFTYRAFQEGMRMLDEGTPDIRLRLVNGAMGSMLRLLGQQSPKELDELRNEMSSMFHQITTDDSDPNSIYRRFNDNPVYYDPSAITSDPASSAINDPDEVSDD